MTFILILMFASMVMTANFMLSSISLTMVSESQQQRLSNALINSLLVEVRDANNISIRSDISFNPMTNKYDGLGSPSFSYNGANHVTANFVYDSRVFDYFQPGYYPDPADDTNIIRPKFREVIFVYKKGNYGEDDKNGKVYVGRAEDSYSLDGSTFTPEEPKALIADAMYHNCVVELNSDSNYFGVTTTGLTPDDTVGSASIRVAFTITDTVTNVTSRYNSVHSTTGHSV